MNASTIYFRYKIILGEVFALEDEYLRLTIDLVHLSTRLYTI